MFKDELNEFFQQLAKSTVSENFRESVTSNYTPRVSHRVLSEQEIVDIDKDSIEITPSYHRPESPKRPSSFMKKRALFRESEGSRMNIKAQNNPALVSKENPLDLITDKTNDPESISPLFQSRNPLDLLLILSVENERLRSELESKAGETETLKGEVETLKRVVEEMGRNAEEKTRVEAENRVRGVIKKFIDEKTAWEADLRKMRDLLDQKTRDFAIFLQNTEKLKTALLDLERVNFGCQSEIERLNEALRKKSQEIAFLEKNSAKSLRGPEEIDQWKARNSKLELGMQELQRNLEAVVLESEGRVGGLMRENEGLRVRLRELENKVAILSVELERLTVVSGRKLEENDQLKQKVNKLEILLTEHRISESKLQKQLQDLKK